MKNCKGERLLPTFFLALQHDDGWKNGASVREEGVFENALQRDDGGRTALQGREEDVLSHKPTYRYRFGYDFLEVRFWPAKKAGPWRKDSPFLEFPALEFPAVECHEVLSFVAANSI